jgi:hypothetical protein
MSSADEQRRRALDEREQSIRQEAAFVRARLDEDEADAQASLAIDPPAWDSIQQLGPANRGLVVDANGYGLWDCEGSDLLCMTGPTARHVARWDPARVLAEIAAKRALVEWCEGAAISGDQSHALAGEVLDQYATLHADHPDFKAEWRIEP